MRFETIGTPTIDLFDPARLRLPVPRHGTEGPPRHAHGEPFLRGPVPFVWVSRASRLPGAGFSLAMLCRFLRDRFPAHPRRYSVADYASGLGASVWTVRRAFIAAERAGVLSVDQKPGRKPVVAIIDPPGPEVGPGRPPLYGPIPWSWWHRTIRLPGKAPQAAMACWLVAGWERAGELELRLGEWTDLGLSRQSAGRGLEALERTGLVTVRRSAGRPPVVRLLATDRSGATPGA